MVIVQGVFRLRPEDRDAFLAQQADSMRASLQDKGCQEYVMAADPLEADRVILSERWESMDDLNAHLRRIGEARAAAASEPPKPSVETLHTDIVRYDVSGSQRMV
jgi:quinol monooxygenase YgiN